jgi:energy-coupling factor transporter transmembrane protein EcfT
MMNTEFITALSLAVFFIVFLYSSVGHAGASGYIAAMMLFGMAPAEIKPIALANVFKMLWLLFLCLPLQNVAAKTLWRGDFETGDLLQWQNLINPAALSVTRECVSEGTYAGKVTLSGDASLLWHGREDLNRSEFHYTPAVASTSEGKETFFGFHFYLPKTLSDGRHELGYWESDKSWQQMMRFNIADTIFSFQETAQQAPFWQIKNGALPKHWHSVAMHIHWSVNPQDGFAQVWVDSKDMGKYFFKTLYEPDALMFTQIGILRQREKAVDVILIDAARETDNLAELLAADAQQHRKTCKK